MHDQSNIAEFFKTTFIIYFALAAGQILFFTIAVVFVESSGNTPNNELDNVFTILVPVFGILMMFTSRTLYYKNVSKTNGIISLSGKLNTYRTFKMISWAQIEAGSIVALVAYMVTFNSLYVFVFLFLIGFFIMIRPSRDNFIKDFNITSEDSDIILRNS